MTQETDGLPPSRRLWAMAAIAVSITLAVMDSSVANVALPAIAADLQVSPADVVLVVNAYQIATIMSLLPFASLGEKFGHERVYRAGLAVFTASSLACALSSSLEMLIISRIAQGFGAAGLMSVNTALLRFIFPQKMLGRGIGINALVVATASVAGPPIGAAVLGVAHWPWIFAINLPLGLLALILTRFLPYTLRSNRRFDAASALLSAATFGLLTVGVEQFTRGQPWWLLALFILGFLACGTLLVRRQAGRTAPLLPVDLLRIPVFALSVATSISSFMAQMLALVVIPFLFQHDFGLTAVQTGLLITPWPLVLIVVAPLSGRLADHINPGLLGGIGLAAMALGLVLMATLPPEPSFVQIGWRMALCGAGFGLFQSPNNRVLLSSAPRERSGGASGMLSTSRLLGQTLGAALAGLALGPLLGGQNGASLALALAAAIAGFASLVSFSRLAATRRA
ncbi:MFS transporter [Pseudoroseomonas ludipueritiae]|uniref:MFS transporter n=1 Tax=Pseudoroseomonas ludipueritiae TaxID=198093 RepID=A0ABR7R5A0_9PROT|nr:MFS transporter [Pseudoroseomonas ludipueritiae]MBC9176949.1 MFS transporter [Pseudoroseomonas ludipueritiae]MCG7361689.1 MFS transporter [Roseomonas sp. ACRSG]